MPCPSRHGDVVICRPAGRLAAIGARLGAALLCAMPRSAPAQADSLAAVARAEYRAGLDAWLAGDLATARTRMVQAATAWPGQPAYVFAAARASARLGDTSATALWLHRAADLGHGRDVGTDADFSGVAAAAGVQAAVARLEGNRGPLVRSHLGFVIPDSGFFAEGVDADPVRREWYVGSIRRGQVVRIDARGRVEPFAEGARLDAVFGIRVDAGRRRLWLTTRGTPMRDGFRPGEAMRSTVLVFSLEDGKLLGQSTLPDDGLPRTLGDLAVAPRDGSAYITDSERPVLYRATYREGDGVSVEPWVSHRLFRSLQGIALAGDSALAYVADYSHGLLLVDLDRRAVRELPAPSGSTTLGLDGLCYWRGSVIGIQNGASPPRVVRLHLSRDGDAVERLEVIDRHLPLAAEPTVGTVLDGRLYYVANSHWPLYDDEGRLKPGAHPAPTAILELPLDP